MDNCGSMSADYYRRRSTNDPGDPSRNEKSRSSVVTGRPNTFVENGGHQKHKSIEIDDNQCVRDEICSADGKNE